MASGFSIVVGEVDNARQADGRFFSQKTTEVSEDVVDGLVSAGATTSFTWTPAVAVDLLAIVFWPMGASAADVDTSSTWQAFVGAGSDPLCINKKSKGVPEAITLSERIRTIPAGTAVTFSVNNSGSAQRRYVITAKYVQ